MSAKPPGTKSRYDHLDSLQQSDSPSDDCGSNTKLAAVSMADFREGIDVCLKLIDDSEQAHARNAIAAKTTNVVDLHGVDTALPLITADQIKDLKVFVMTTSRLMEKHLERQSEQVEASEAAAAINKMKLH